MQFQGKVQGLHWQSRKGWGSETPNVPKGTVTDNIRRQIRLQCSRASSGTCDSCYLVLTSCYLVLTSEYMVVTSYSLVVTSYYLVLTSEYLVLLGSEYLLVGSDQLLLGRVQLLLGRQEISCVHAHKSSLRQVF